MTPRPPCRPARGFTLIEMMCAVAVACILSSVAYPTYQSIVQRARRADALIAMLQVEMAQERWRADHGSYAGLADLRIAALSGAGYYRLLMPSRTDTGYELHAIARGGQHADAECRHLKLRVDGASSEQASGRDEHVGNTDAANRRCWSR